MVLIKEDPMRKYNPHTFTFSSVKGEVTEAVHYDWKRDKVDDAKKRAIYQAKSYDDFTERVKGCTLKPIHKKEFNEPPKFAFNRQPGNHDGTLPLARLVGSSHVGSGEAEKRGAGASKGIPHTAASSALPGSCRELERELRRRGTAEEKAALIAQMDGDTCARVFAKELDGELLRQMLFALEAARPDLARRLLQDLAARCPKPLAIASSFLDASDRGMVARMLAGTPATDPGEDVRIFAALCIPPAMVTATTRQLSTSQPEGVAESEEAAAAAETLLTSQLEEPVEPEAMVSSELPIPQPRADARPHEGFSPPSPSSPRGAAFSCDAMD